jgi:calcineurin-like phosphoesterase family protein
MNEVMISNWNEVVRDEDIVYHVGDVAFEKDENKLIRILSLLAGEIHLIRGNHDNLIRGRISGRFHSIEHSGLREISVEDPDGFGGRQPIVLCHYAMRVWNRSHFGAWHLYGHSHGTLPDDETSLSLDVGVDCWNYYPVSYEQIKERMKTKKFVPIDQHKGKAT